MYPRLLALSVPACVMLALAVHVCACVCNAGPGRACVCLRVVLALVGRVCADVLPLT